MAHRAREESGAAEDMRRMRTGYLVVAIVGVSLWLAPPAAGRQGGSGQEAARALGARDEALRWAIEDLVATFPERYPRGAEYLRRLDAIEAETAEIPDRPDRLDALRREALIANPLVSDHPLLFVVRRQYRSDHHNTATLFQTGEVNTASFEGGSALKTIELGEGGRVRTLLEVPAGVVRDPEVQFDGSSILVSLRQDAGDDYHLWELEADGGEPRQLTFAPGVADVDPLYLPDGGIAFTSSREPKYCMCNQHIMANLFRMDADGANIHQIGKSTLFEGHGALLPDGRILYDRWEYVDRNFGDAQGLWTVWPDGTGHAVYWGNNTCSPGGAIDARPLPGGQRAICVFGSCHDRPWGALAVIDRRLGVDGRPSVVRTWPASAVELVGQGDWDTFKRVRPRYEDPWPLSEKHFLCAGTIGEGERTGIWLLDVFGNQLLLHAEEPGCFDPMPLSARPRPPVLPPRRQLAGGTSQLYVTDVHRGTHMRGVERGEVKYLRVIESPEKRTFTHPAWGGQGVQKPAMNWHDFNNKRILGTVPVEADGSAYFELPSDTYVYFQLLDADGMMVQSMRSGMMTQAGERVGCTGCHEERRGAPPVEGAKMPIALGRAPSRLEGWRGPPRPFSYVAEVQPVFDRACVSCHDFGPDAGGMLNLAPDRTTTFNASYNELWRKGYVGAIGAGPAGIQEARAWGSHASRLVRVLREGHEGVELSPEELDRIVTWIDLNAPYYPDYACAYPDNLGGRSPLDEGQTRRLAELTGVPFSKLADHRGNRGPQLSFDRPELSPCLIPLRDAEPGGHAEALTILLAGQSELRGRPRADMPGFRACEADRRRLEKYAHRQRVELENRAAAAEGRKRYEGPAD